MSAIVYFMQEQNSLVEKRPCSNSIQRCIQRCCDIIFGTVIGLLFQSRTILRFYTIKVKIVKNKYISMIIGTVIVSVIVSYERK